MVNPSPVDGLRSFDQKIKRPAKAGLDWLAWRSRDTNLTENNAALRMTEGGMGEVGRLMLSRAVLNSTKTPGISLG